MLTIGMEPDRPAPLDPGFRRDDVQPYAPLSDDELSLADAPRIARTVVSTGCVSGSSLVVWTPSSGKRRACVRTRDSKEPTPLL